MIGPKAIKIAIISTLLTAIIVGAIVVVVLLTTEEECEITNLSFSQNGNVLHMTWEGGTCEETYSVSIYVDSELVSNEVITNSKQYEYENLLACTSVYVTVTANEKNVSTSKFFNPEFVEVTDVQVIGNTVTWDNPYLVRCKFEVIVDNGQGVMLDEGSNAYELDQSLEPCVKHSLTLKAVNSKDEKGPSFVDTFEIGPSIDDFIINAVNTLDYIYLKAVWTNNHPRCNCVVYYKDMQSTCDDTKKEECTFLFEEEIKPCQDYEFELRAISPSQNEWVAATYKYIPSANDEVIDDFIVEYKDRKTIAKWKSMGSGCKYYLVLAKDQGEIQVGEVDSQPNNQVIEYEIPNDELDLCAINNIHLIVVNGNGANVATTEFDYKTQPNMGDINLFSDTKILAKWRSLGESCSYDVHLNGELNINTKQSSIYVDDAFQITTKYCENYEVSVNARTVEASVGPPTSKDIVKALIDNFEGISSSMKPVIIQNIIYVEWFLLDEVSSCRDIYYKVSCSLDGEAPTMEPEDSNESSYRATKCPIDSKTRTFHIYIQPIQKDQFNDVIGSLIMCTFKIENMIQAIWDRCDYMDRNTI